MSIALAFDSVTRNACSARSGIGAAESDHFACCLVSIARRAGSIARAKHRHHEKAGYRRAPSEHRDWNRQAKEQVPVRMRSGT